MAGREAKWWGRSGTGGAEGVSAMGRIDGDWVPGWGGHAGRLGFACARDGSLFGWVAGFGSGAFWSFLSHGSCFLRKEAPW